MTESEMKASSFLPAADLAWYLVFVGAGLILACGRVSSGANEDGDSTASSSGGKGPTDASSEGTGGVSSSVGGNVTEQTSGTVGSPPTGIVIPPSVGGAGGDGGDRCSVNALLEAITRQVGGVTWCGLANAMLDPDEELSARRGAVVIDEEGRVVDVTGREGEAKQRWLDEMADQRWPCLAGQTVGYQCPSPN